jgi:hypothetical protein
MHHRQQKGINQQTFGGVSIQRTCSAPITQKEGYGGKLHDPRKKKKVYQRK